MLLLALVMGTCGSIANVEAVSVPHEDETDAHFRSCEPAPAATAERPSLTVPHAVPGAAVLIGPHIMALVSEASAEVRLSATGPPRFLLHSALLI